MLPQLAVTMQPVHLELKGARFQGGNSTTQKSTTTKKIYELCSQATI